MIKLDENLLAELGLGALPKDEKTAFLKHMYETLEMRVGTRLAERMSDQQMSEFERFIQGNDEQGAFQWLESNFPNYKEVVAEEFEKLKNEIRPLSQQIVASSQAQAQQAQHQPAHEPLPQGNGPVQAGHAPGAVPPHSEPQQYASSPYTSPVPPPHDGQPAGFRSPSHAPQPVYSQQQPHYGPPAPAAPAQAPVSPSPHPSDPYSSGVPPQQPHYGPAAAQAQPPQPGIGQLPQYGQPYAAPPQYGPAPPPPPAGGAQQSYGQHDQPDHPGQ